ncbi:hypothetical protein M407DRAFT_7849 [Tulasnella calospora MUT 4182]|uniref:C3H1-type domain-containing protein n=1 Tax=Tulasnella calospora MUT 4182 TaxID=1051891 RepID=A0A0C3Q935_9AGAM|nr:hypothetical protein M407DRAFT_7849 [Tulasnella calospora MUT 4182]
MSHLNDPPWKVKTRPCPFYTRGNCLFASSCNFIHTVKSPVAPEVRITEASIREATSDDGLEPSKSRGGIIGIGGNNITTLNNNSHKDGYADGPSTPPNVISPPFSDDTPPHDDQDFAPQPSIWGSGRRRYSWAPSISLPPEDGVAEETKVLTPASANSDPDGQVLDVKSPAPLGDAFVLRSPKPRRTKSSKAASSVHQDSDIEYDDTDMEGLGLEVEDPTVRTTDSNPESSSPQPESPEQAALEDMFLYDSAAPSDDRPPPRRSLHRQMTLHEVMLNLQDPSSRPRRIDRIMQGLSPETPINSVLPERATSTTSDRPAPFQGNGDRKSRAFVDHLASLMAKRSAQLSDPDWEKNQGRRPRIMEDMPGSAPATKTQFSRGAVQRQQTLPHLPESVTRMKMSDVRTYSTALVLLFSLTKIFCCSFR